LVFNVENIPKINAAVEPVGTLKGSTSFGLQLTPLARVIESLTVQHQKGSDGPEIREELPGGPRHQS
jgi:hypothetical protein